VLGLRVVVAAFLSAPTFACLAFLNAKPAWRKDEMPTKMLVTPPRGAWRTT
jgi:hypothetical protein